MLISALTVHRDFVCILAEEAYRRGAFFVNILYQDEKLQKSQLLFGDEKSLDFVSESMKQAYEEVLQYKGVFISIADREEVKGFENIPASRLGKVFLSRAHKLNFFQKAVQKNAIRWCVVSAATTGRARTVFPHMDETEAVSLLWQNIFNICKVDQDDPAAAWSHHLAVLSKRKKTLNTLGISSLAFSSPLTRLTAGLHPRAVWLGGSSVSADGIVFYPNIPTEEVFTAPDFHTLNGHFEATRPVTYKNLYIEKVSARFENGSIISLEGSHGITELREIVFAEKQNAYAGEIALVDSSSSVACSNLVFHDLLYDENAESHIAIGSAYQECLPDSRNWDSHTKAKAGFNESQIHIDIMLGSPVMDVSASTRDNKQVQIIQQGHFCI